MILFDIATNTLDTEPFILDEVMFNLMHLIRDTETPLMLENDSGKVIIAQSAPLYPAWVWTDNSLEDDEFDELGEEFYRVFSNRSELSFVAKPSIADSLANHYASRKNISWKIDLKMESYYCPHIKAPVNVDGGISKPTFEDTVIISEFFAGFIWDCFGKSTTANEQIETAEKFIQSNDFYIWKVNGEIVSMANIAHRSPRHARINEVYTLPSKRMKGYAGALVAELCKIILNENRVPILYTDLSNPASNKAYKNIGFVECGKVNQLSFIF